MEQTYTRILKFVQKNGRLPTTTRIHQAEELQFAGLILSDWRPGSSGTATLTEEGLAILSE